MVDTPSNGTPAPGTNAAVPPNVCILRSPVTVDGHTYDRLTFRRPKGRDYVAMSEAAESLGAMTSMHMFAAALAGVPSEVIDELEDEDHTAVLAMVVPFMERKVKAMGLDNGSGTSHSSRRGQAGRGRNS